MSSREGGTKAVWKGKYFEKMAALMDEYPKCFIVGADNVGSKQMQVFVCLFSIYSTWSFI